MTKIKNFLKNLFKKGGDDKMKQPWSLKKKLLVAGAGLAGVVVGIFTYGKTRDFEPDTEDYFEDEDGVEDYYDTPEEDEVSEETDGDIDNTQV